MEGVRTVQHERLTIQEAAHRLGVSERAIRKRIKQGTLKREKTEDGRVLVHMEPSAPGAVGVRTPERDALIFEMQKRLAFLERELDVRTEEIRRRDTIIMNMTETMKALSPPSQEAPPDERESPQTVEQQQGRAHTHPTPLREGLRRAHSVARGGVGCSEDERQGPENVEAHATATRKANRAIRGGA
jgi:excisionase family DNA binding protein